MSGRAGRGRTEAAGRAWFSGSRARWGQSEWACREGAHRRCGQRVGFRDRGALGAEWVGLGGDGRAGSVDGDEDVPGRAVGAAEHREDERVAGRHL